jgi:uncharacterized protein YjiS (DUF1127 family)
MTQVLGNITSWLKRQEKLRRTVRELAALSDRELSDIGLSRCDIYNVAKEVTL